ncbi:MULTISPECIES: helix-turn-helix domain-containing protein [unclassified Nonomuraea]|uniref:TetR/AcrR family transcriptional regulator n=1 Tax=unclassified Nonomuraea TaxID=2593643 RepID=UPI003331388E
MREDTRARIQEIALKLFTEQGYEATSLREIAEELGVTKAALYYHFKTKEDIIGSLVDLRVAELQELLEWARNAPKTPETRRELLERYAERLRQPRYLAVARFLESNQTAMRNHPQLAKMRDTMMELTAEMSDAGATPTERISRSLALFALHAGKWLSMAGEGLTEEEIDKACMEVALRLVEQ